MERNVMSGHHEIILNSTLAVTVSSVDELKAVVEPLKKKKFFKPSYVSVAVNEYKVLSRVFNFPNASHDEIRKNIVSEACDLLSLPAHKIEVDFQVFPTDHETARGVFICAPKELVQNYLEVMDNAKLIPLKLTDSIFARIDSLFLINRELRNDGGCLVDLSLENTIYIAVIEQKSCTFFRKVHYQTHTEAGKAVIQTLQGICSLSPSKTINQVYVVGDFENQDELITKIQEMSDVVVQSEPFNPNKALVSHNNMFSLNLLCNCAFRPMERNFLMAVQYCVVLLLLLQSIFLAIDIHQQAIIRNVLRASVNLEHYDYALQLQEELK